MNSTLLPKFIELYEAFKHTEDYALRVQQFAIVEVNREIIKETLLNEPLLNEYLTGFIQMFKYECGDETFDKYITQNIADPVHREELSNKAYEIGEWGYVGAGLNAITKLTTDQLLNVKAFLSDAFGITALEEAIQLCKDFDGKQIPFVKSGIYSPWLYYINPQLFPILNNSHIIFRQWIGMPPDYPSCINDFNELKVLVNENELGVLDFFAHCFMKVPGETDIESFVKKLHKYFNIIWRCATSNKWEAFKEKSILSVEWIDANVDYINVEDQGHGQTVKTRWVNNLREGDLIVVMDKYNYYGLAIAKSSYQYKENDVDIDGRLWPSIKVKFIHQLQSPINHQLDIKHRNPAAFYQLNGLGFNESDTFTFIQNKYPTVIDHLQTLMADMTPVNDDPIISNNYPFPKNSILYGPPGTGKTYNSIFYAVAIVEQTTFENIKAEGIIPVKKRFDDYKEEGRIVFTTFHQSLGYEDFIEGIKPIPPGSEGDPINYRVEDGIFKRLCTQAAFQIANSLQSDAKTTLTSFENRYDYLVADINEKLLSGEKYELQTRSGGTIFVDSVTDLGNILVKHDPQTQTYTVSKKRLAKLESAFANLDEVANINTAFRAVIGGTNASAYWAVLNAIRNINPPMPAAPAGNYDYEAKKELIEKLPSADFKGGSQKPFVIIIDEINRGNIAQIFGELITLIEDDKRLGQQTGLTVTLPYSKERFGVPPNVFVIGTMNTADRSVEALDTALRRRFAFIHKPPEASELNSNAEGINLSAILETLNKRLTILKDSDHTIGHAWLLGIENVEQLKNVFGSKILPLLQEYFYNDYEKLGLVLGDQFFNLTEQVVSNDVFASFSGSNGLAGQYDQSWQYQLKKADELIFEDFKSLESLKLSL